MFAMNEDHNETIHHVTATKHVGFFQAGSCTDIVSIICWKKPFKSLVLTHCAGRPLFH